MDIRFQLSGMFATVLNSNQNYNMFGTNGSVGDFSLSFVKDEAVVMWLKIKRSSYCDK